MPNWKMIISYDGSEYHGWQVQPGVRTVQGELNYVLKKLFDMPVRTVGASRTDAGVHALMQVANVELPDRFEVEDLRRRMNLMLPDDVAVGRIEKVADDFSARYSAIGKRYEYRIIFSKDPHRRNGALLLHRLPDIDILNRTAGYLIGEHDFTAFAKLQSIPENPACKIAEARWVQLVDGLNFVIEGNRFLHQMVRSLVGAMLDCARGRFSPEQFKDMVESGKRIYDYKVVGAKGLWLVEVIYD